MGIFFFKIMIVTRFNLNNCSSTASITITFENAGLSLNGKCVFTHTDLTVNLQNGFSQTLR